MLWVKVDCGKFGKVKCIRITLVTVDEKLLQVDPHGVSAVPWVLHYFLLLCWLLREM